MYIAAISWFSSYWFKYSTWKQFSWGNSFWLYALIAIPIIFLLSTLIALLQANRFKVAFRKKDLHSSSSSFLRFIPTLFLALALIFLFIALARPQRTDEQVDRWSEGIDIMLILDISESMRIEDLHPNRLEAAKKVAIQFIKGRFQDRIGVVIFAGEAYSLSPLTTDYGLLNTYLKDIDFSQIENPGTAIGSAMAVGINRMRESKSKSKVIILLSDGDNTAGTLDPLTTAGLARAYGIKLYTILIGREGRVPYGKDVFGNTQYIENSVDESTLKKIAEVGEGQFFRATSSSSLNQIFAKINKYEKSEIKETRYKNTQDFYRVYLIWSIVIWLIWLLLKSTFMNNFLED